MSRKSKKTSSKAIKKVDKKVAEAPVKPAEVTANNPLIEGIRKSNGLSKESTMQDPIKEVTVEVVETVEPTAEQVANLAKLQGETPVNEPSIDDTKPTEAMSAGRSNEAPADPEAKKGEEAPADEEPSPVTKVGNAIASAFKGTYNFFKDLVIKGWNGICAVFNSIGAGFKGVGYGTAAGYQKVKGSLTRSNASNASETVAGFALLAGGTIAGISLLYMALVAYGIVTVLVSAAIVFVVAKIAGFAFLEKEDRDAIIENAKEVCRPAEQAAA